jgi:hypothetical protein
MTRKKMTGNKSASFGEYRDVQKHTPVAQVAPVRWKNFYRNNVLYWQAQEYVFGGAGFTLRHLKIVRVNESEDEAKRNAGFFMQDLHYIKNYFYGTGSYAVYVLPAENDLVNGANTQHLFTYSGILKDTAASQGLKSEDVVWNRIINFPELMETKAKLLGAGKSAVIALTESYENQSTYKIQEWDGYIPNLRKMYKYGD